MQNIVNRQWRQLYLKLLKRDFTQLTLNVLVTAIDAQWEGMGCRVGEVRAGATSPMPDHKGFKATVTSKFSEIQHFKS